MNTYSRLAVSVCAALSLQACAMGRLDHLTSAPSMSAPGAPRVQVPPTSEERIALARRAAPPPTEPASSGSLWHSGPTSLFGDRRARTLGDILTVVIEIDEQAELKNRTDRTRDASEGLSVPNFFGLASLAADVLPNGATLAPAIDATSSTSNNGDGNIKREEKITLQVAATVSHVLPTV